MGPVSLSTFAYGRCDLTTANGTFRLAASSRFHTAKTRSGHFGRNAAHRIRPSLRSCEAAISCLLVR